MAKIELIARVVWIEDGMVLLCRNRWHGHCYLPGGHVEFGETVQAAAAREMREEAGIEVNVGVPVQAFESVFVQKAKTRHEVVFACHVEHASCSAEQVRSREDDIEFLMRRLDALEGSGFVPVEQREWLQNVGRVANGPILRSAISRA
jgi:ADP-ribose pyrophosphatase YjhB (NUDIX family)